MKISQLNEEIFSFQKPHANVRIDGKQLLPGSVTYDVDTDTINISTQGALNTPVDADYIQTVRDGNGARVLVDENYEPIIGDNIGVQTDYRGDLNPDQDLNSYPDPDADKKLETGAGVTDGHANTNADGDSVDGSIGVNENTGENLGENAELSADLFDLSNPNEHSDAGHQEGTTDVSFTSGDIA